MAVGTIEAPQEEVTDVKQLTLRDIIDENFDATLVKHSDSESYITTPHFIIKNDPNFTNFEGENGVHVLYSHRGRNSEDSIVFREHSHLHLPIRDLFDGVRTTRGQAETRVSYDNGSFGSEIPYVKHHGKVLEVDSNVHNYIASQFDDIECHPAIFSKHVPCMAYIVDGEIRAIANFNKSNM